MWGERDVKRYYKGPGESMIGTGVIYIEFDGEWPTRQAERYDNQWFCSKKAFHPGIGPGLSDRPLSELDLTQVQEISQEEFEEAWNEALRHVQ
jgi:hypothetical protein